MPPLLWANLLHPSFSFSDEENNPSHILDLKTRSSFTESSLREFVKENNLTEICNFIPIPHCRIDNPLVGDIGFYIRVIKDGIWPPIHQFFYEILDSYIITQGQLIPLAYCYMMRMLMMWITSERSLRWGSGTISTGWRLGGANPTRTMWRGMRRVGTCW